MNRFAKYSTAGQSPASFERTLPKRKYSYDNLRCLFIFCVVFGHLLEICPPFCGSNLLYRIIYSFHMPAFIFLVGYFSKYNPKRIIFNYIIPYIVFQTLYIWFSRTLLHTESALQYTTPYWHLWFLLVCIYYQLLIPFFDTDKKKKQYILLAVTVILALLVGYENTIGYYASLSRFFVFLPWFVLGFYYRKHESAITNLPVKAKIIQTVFSVAVILFSLFLLHSSRITSNMLYGSFSYASIGYSITLRFLFMLIALGWISIFFVIFTNFINIKIPLLTTIGQNTLPIFLLHGFIVKLIAQYYPGICSRPLFVVLTSCGIVIVFGNRYLGRCFKWIFAFIEKCASLPKMLKSK